MAGRPSKLTPAIAKAITDVLSAGNFIETACDYASIDYKTFYNWMKWGERGTQKDIDAGYTEFFHMVKKAMSDVEILTVADVRKGVFNWQSRAWWLERRHPDRWGNRQRNTNVNMTVDVANLPDDILERIARGEDVDLSTVASASRARAAAAS